MARNIRFYENYFMDFYVSLNPSVQEKIEYVFKVIRTVDRIPQKFLKHVTGTDGLYEIRIKAGNNIHRVFCCFDAGQVIVLFNGFQKKSQKAPKKDIDKALRLKQEYFNEKNRGKK
jgi:phage-related protein